MKFRNMKLSGVIDVPSGNLNMVKTRTFAFGYKLISEAEYSHTTHGLVRNVPSLKQWAY